MYYTAKCKKIILNSMRCFNVILAKKEDNPEEALIAFKTIVEKEDEKGDW